MKNAIRVLAASAFAISTITLDVAAGPEPVPTSRPFTPLKLGSVRGLALDRAGNLYVPDHGSATLHKITPSGVSSVVPTAPIKFLHAVTVAPDGTLYAVEAEASLAHKLDGKGATPLVPADRKDVFLGPTTLACDAEGNLYIGENDVNIVRKVTPKGEISIFAGAFKQVGNQDGSAAEARFTRPRGLAVDGDGNVFVADEAAHIVRKIARDGSVTTIAGKAGERGSEDGAGVAARFSSPRGLATDRSGNVYVMDTMNHTVRKVTRDGVVTTVAGKAGEKGFADGPAKDSRFSGPRAGVIDSAGNLFVADSDNGAIRMIAVDGKVKTIVGALPSPPAGSAATR